MCSVGSFAFVLVLAFSVAVAESRDSFNVLGKS